VDSFTHFSHQNLAWASSLQHTCHMHCPSHSSFYHPDKFIIFCCHWQQISVATYSVISGQYVTIIITHFLRKKQHWKTINQCPWRQNVTCFISSEYPCSDSEGINSTEATKEFKQTIKSRLPFITSHKSEACSGYTILTASLCKVTLDTPSINNNSPFSFPWYNTSSYQQGVANIFYSRACVYILSLSPLVTLRHITAVTYYPHSPENNTQKGPICCFGVEGRGRLSLGHKKFTLNIWYDFTTKKKYILWFRWVFRTRDNIVYVKWFTKVPYRWNSYRVCLWVIQITFWNL